MKTWLVVFIGLCFKVVKWLIGLRSKSRIRLEVKDEAVIADERKRMESLKAEVGRLENELAEIACKVATAIVAADGHRIIELNDRRRKLHDEWDTARQRLLDFEGYISQGR